MNIQLDITPIILALLGIVSTIVTTIFIPYVLQLWKNSKTKGKFDEIQSEIAKNELLAKQLEALRATVLESVKAAGERAWKESGVVKREEAMKQAKDMLEKQGLTFDDDVISKTMDAAVDEWRKSIVENIKEN